MIDLAARRKIAESMIDSVDWNHYPTQASAEIAPILRELIATEQTDLWSLTGALESAVVPSGQLYPAAIPVASILLALLALDLVSARSWVWDLLFWIARGQAAKSFPSSLGPRVRDTVRQGLWLCYAELHTEAALDALGVLNVIEKDRAQFVEIQRRLEAYQDVPLSEQEEDFFIDDESN